MADIELINSTTKEFEDISSESYRKYYFGTKNPFKNFDVITIKAPQYLYVSPSGHRVLDGDGVSHYIPSGFLHIEWKAKEGKPPFVK